MTLPLSKAKFSGEDVVVRCNHVAAVSKAAAVTSANPTSKRMLWILTPQMVLYASLDVAVVISYASKGF